MTTEMKPQGYYTDKIFTPADMDKAIAKEREECAMLCLWHNNTMSQNPTLFHMAQLIRARGEA